MAQAGEAHLSWLWAACGQKGASRLLQSIHLHRWMGSGQLQEEAECGGHDGGVAAVQQCVQKAENVKELVLAPRLVAQQEGKHLALSPAV